MTYLLMTILGIVVFIGGAWLAKSFNKTYLTWLSSLTSGLLLVWYSFSKSGFEGFYAFSLGVVLVVIGVIGSLRYKSKHQRIETE